MGTAHLAVRLRPTRFGFLVAPNDMRSLERVFRINTCLWGGKYNPIIPVFASRPGWWARHGLRGETAGQIVNGYLDYFEPDVVVETVSGQAASLGYAESRVVAIDRLVPPANRRDVAYSETVGLSVFSLYHQLFEKEFQFTKRLPEKMVRIASAKPVLAPLAACIFGGFPKDGALHQLEGVFDEVFTPEILTLAPDTVADIVSGNWCNPLHVTHDGLEVHYGRTIDPAIFVFDGTRPGDLIDYWTLRAGIARVVPIPIQFASELSSFARDFVRRNFRPLPNNTHGVMIRPRVMFGRSIRNEDIPELFEKHFRVDVDGANCLQDWYPPIWRPSPQIMVAPTRPTVTAATSEQYLGLNGEEPALEFNALTPDFADLYGGRLRWANVVRIEDWTRTDHFATTYLDDYRDPKQPSFGGGVGEVLTTSEGFVKLADYSVGRHFWGLESNASAVRTWLANRGVETELSGSGRATQQIIQTLGGLNGVSAVASPDVIQLLNGMARKPLAKSMEHHQFRNRVRDAVAGRLWNRRAARTLIDKDAVELGLEVHCDKCGSWSWYALNELATTLKCGLCLKAFAFPVIDPSAKDNTRWAYRLIGPFAQPDYAQGGYASALSIRFFAVVLQGSSRPGLTWSAGQELKLQGGSRVEADFILWYSRKEIFGHRSSTELVFGEAKSFGRDSFTADDVERMKRLAIAFPGAILVFATMKSAEELTNDEIARISALARWGRHYETRARRSRAPVIVLTGCELFADYALSRAWEAVGGRHKEIIAPAYVHPDNLRVLADLTQQLYLGMEPYHAAIRRRWEGRRPSATANPGGS
jgi:hypothetical protein